MSDRNQNGHAEDAKQKDRAQQLFTQIERISSEQDPMLQQVLSEIDKLEGNTTLLSTPVQAERIRVQAVSELCILSYIATKLSKPMSRVHEALLQVARRLISAGADLTKLSGPIFLRDLDFCMNERDSSSLLQLTPLACAFAFDSQDWRRKSDSCLEFVEVLLQAGVDLAKDETAFVLACLRYDVPLVKVLLNNGAKVESKLPNGMPASIALSGHCSKHYLHRPEKHGEYNEGWRGKWRDLVRVLLEHGADPTVLFPQAQLPSAKMSLLSVAIATGDVRLSKDLVELGAPVFNYDKEEFLYTDMEQPSSGHLTPLNECMIRLAEGQEEMLELFYVLMRNGADLRSGGTGSNKYTWNPTLLCTMIGCAKLTGGNAALREVVRYILDQGVDVKEEKYALCLSVLTLDTELFEMLLGNGFDCEACRMVDESIPTLGPNQFQMPKKKCPGRYRQWKIPGVKVTLLIFLLKKVYGRVEVEESVLEMAKCLLRHGVDMNFIADPMGDYFHGRTNALTVALIKRNMPTAKFLVERGISLKVDQVGMPKYYRNIFGRALDHEDTIETALFLVDYANPEVLNEVDYYGLTALGYAASLRMHANSKREVGQNSTTSRVHEGESDEQRQRREMRAEARRKQLEKEQQERDAKHAAEDAQVEGLINAMLEAGASPFVLQADKDWYSSTSHEHGSLFEICARSQRWKQIEIMVTHSSGGRAQDFVNPLIFALVGNAPLMCVELLLDRVDSVRSTFMLETKKAQEESKSDKEDVEPYRWLTHPQRYAETSLYRVKSGLSVLTSAGSSTLENLKAVLARAKREGVSLDTPDLNGNTVLSELLLELPEMYGDGVRLLLSEGADPNFKTGSKAVEPIMIASARTTLSRSTETFPDISLGREINFFTAHRSPAVVQLLRDQGASFSSTDKDGRTAFHHACLSGSTRLVEWYLHAFSDEDKAALINLRLPNTGITPTMLVCSVRGTESVIPKLVVAGADLSAVANDNNTALSLAVVTRASLETVQALLANGADPNVGNHPLIAATRQVPRVWELIHKLLDELDIHQEIAQAALNELLVDGEKEKDLYGDYRITARCWVGARATQEHRRAEAVRETRRIKQKLIARGANVKLAKAASPASTRSTQIVECLNEWRFLS